MVLISHRHKYIFIHIPKTAGQTLKHNLPSDEIGECHFYGIGNLQPKCWSKGQYRNLYHLTYQEIKEVYPEIPLDQYTIFTFVRNPYDRLYSTYLYCKKEIKNEALKILQTLLILLTVLLVLVMGIYGLIYKQRKIEVVYGVLGVVLVLVLWHYRYIQLLYHLMTCDFNDFVHRHMKQLYRLSPLVFATQSSYLKGVRPDFIGREERFQTDWKRLHHRLGLKLPSRVKNVNVIYRRKRGGQYKYIKYFDTRTIRWVNRFYRDDFQQLGYPMIPV